MEEKINQTTDSEAVITKELLNNPLISLEQAIKLAKQLQLDNAKAIAKNEEVNKRIDELIEKWKTQNDELSNTYKSAMEVGHEIEAGLMKQDIIIFEEFISDLQTLKTK